MEENNNSPKAGEREVKPIPKAEKPLGQIEEQKRQEQPKAILKEGEVIYRHFDSDDIVRLRSGTVIAEVENQNLREEEEVKLKNRLSVDMGQLQKITICLGIQKCPWFSDIIREEDGVTDEIYIRRMRMEFRKFPVDKIDILFKEAQNFNKAEFKAGDLKKKL